ncbi:hypothetical protein ACJIZ3_019373 [Penstemon smallii]|uniref:EF-hand domain-containing protein n=1 Tax=Penstemon smallii TaxID=265156 RepID=A0ABD3T0Z6_9LAMI
MEQKKDLKQVLVAPSHVTSSMDTDSSPKSAFRRFYRKIWPRKRNKPSDNHDPPSVQGCDEIEQVFKQLDENGDGQISPKELQTLARKVGGSDSELLSEEEAEIVVKSSDVNGDGALGLEDFTNLMETGGGDDELKGVFKMYAVDTGSYITPKSLRKMLSRLSGKTTLQDCETMISKFDLNGDGVLSFDEFRIMMTMH